MKSFFFNVRNFWIDLKSSMVISTLRQKGWVRFPKISIFTNNLIYIILRAHIIQHSNVNGIYSVRTNFIISLPISNIYRFQLLNIVSLLGRHVDVGVATIFDFVEIEKFGCFLSERRFCIPGGMNRHIVFLKNGRQQSDVCSSNFTYLLAFIFPLC